MQRDHGIDVKDVAFREVIEAHGEAVSSLSVLAEKLESAGHSAYAGMVVGQKKALLGAMSVMLEARRMVYAERAQVEGNQPC